jgi:hypothetical protein
VNDAAVYFDDEQDVVALSITESTPKKSVAKIPLGWAERNCAQVGPRRRAAGDSPYLASTLATLVFEP